MGKTSRSKGTRSDADRSRKTREQVLSLFLNRAGISAPTSSQQLWSNIESKLGLDFADKIETALNERISNAAEGRPNDDGVYDLIYRDLDAATETVSFVTPMLRAWAVHMQGLELPTGPMIDLGSGSGILTCFYATIRPDTHVTGIEIHPGGVACGQALAERLGLSNVTFIEGDVLNFQSEKKFSSVTSVASLTEMEGETAEPSHPFSTFRSGEAAWLSGTSSLAQAAERFLHRDGVFVSMERLPDFGELARWIGAVQRAGLGVDLCSSAYLNWDSPPSGKEAMPVLVATKHEPAKDASFADLADWYGAREIASDSPFLAELELIEAPTLKLVAGRHFDVVDAFGSGQTRVYVIDRDDDAVLYMSTNRGHRSIMLAAPTSSQLMPNFEELLYQFAESPEIIGGRELFSSDLSEELGRIVLA